jgi:cytochrome c oxidase subunit 1
MLEAYHNDYDDDGFRTCGTTGMRVHQTAENLVKLHGLTAVIALLVGGIFAFFVAMTRWEMIGLLDAGEFYRFLSMHAWNLLIFWMVFMEIAILYVGGPFVLGRKLSWPRVAKAGYVLMLGSAVLVNVAIWTTSSPNQQPLLTSYPPLPSSALFYGSVLAFLVSTTIAALPFFATIYQEKREHSGKTLPLVTFGAFITAVVATEALLGGIATYAYTLSWRVGVISSIDPGIYRQLYWTIGHGSQQINLLAMISVWYFLTHVVGDAEVASEKVSRSAFVLYLFFINMGAAHHLMVDPGASVGWKVWNTSYAAYGAVIASMIHAFAIPAGLEAGRRKKGKGGGLFGWLWSAPWKDPGFSATILSIIMFGFLGGITGVMMGQMQLNMTWHNTLAVPGHFHATVATGTTLAFMGLVFYVLRLVFRREWVLQPLASAVPYIYGGAMAIVVLMMMYLGVLYGVPRRHPSVMNIPGTEFGFNAASPLFAIFGVFALLALIGGALFLVVAVGTLLVGDDLDAGGGGETIAAASAASPVPDGGEADDEAVEESEPPAADHGEDDDPVHGYSMRGTFVMTLIFLAVFVVTWALNWYLLGQLWQIGV